MNNVIKILIYVLVVLLLVSWLFTVGKSCTGEDKTPETIEVVKDRTDSASDLMDELESPDFTEELESILDEEETMFEETEAQPGTEVAAKKITTPAVEEPKVEEKQVEEKPQPKPKPPVTTSTSGKFLVVAGSFIHPDNADNMRAKISKLGYDAEVVAFELSEYHSVLAGRFATYDDAQATVNQLKKDGIDAYVKRRTR